MNEDERLEKLHLKKARRVRMPEACKDCTYYEPENRVAFMGYKPCDLKCGGDICRIWYRQKEQSE